MKCRCTVPRLPLLRRRPPLSKAAARKIDWQRPDGLQPEQEEEEARQEDRREVEEEVDGGGNWLGLVEDEDEEEKRPLMMMIEEEEVEVELNPFWHVFSK